jgi:hypothetical protein
MWYDVNATSNGWEDRLYARVMLGCHVVFLECKCVWFATIIVPRSTVWVGSFSGLIAILGSPSWSVPPPPTNLPSIVL